MERNPYVYILTNRPHGTLYIGVTSSLVKRIWEHKNHLAPGFTAKYNLHNLVWYEQHTDMQTAISREKALKFWKRDWKLKLIEEMNPIWRDLYPDIL